MNDAADYRRELLRIGVGVEVSEGVLPQLCRRLIRSRELGANADDVNLIAVVRPDVVDAVRLGAFADEEGRSVLVLPPDQGLLDAVRDALWIESGLPQVEKQRHERRTSRRTWAKFMHGLIVGLSWACESRGVPLGPRSTLCHQDRVVTALPPGEVIGPRGVITRHEHDAWARVRLPIPPSVGFPDPSFLSFDLCAECGATTASRVLLGVATIGNCEPHEHVWTDFEAPTPDAKGVFGTVSGQTCMVACPRGENASPGRCLATRFVTFRPERKAVMFVMPSWVRKDRPILRPGLKTGRAHRHLWIKSVIELGAGATLSILRCVTCDARLFSNKITGQTIPEIAREIRKHLKPYGGFARVPPEILDELRTTLRPRWGEWLQRFTDAAAMITCKTGGPLRETTAKELEQATRFLERAREIDQ